MGPEAKWTVTLTAAILLCSEAWLLFACLWNFRPHPSLTFSILAAEALVAQLET